jgi:NlpC/P60 family putative phage cell wall peptidase
MRDEIYTEARKWVGTPYHHHGRKIGQSCDCIGLILGVGRALKLKVPTELEMPDYSPVPDGATCESMAEKYLARYGSDRMANSMPGQVGMFFYSKRGIGQHFCIFGWHADTGRKTMIHAFMRGRHVIETGISEFWERRLMRVYDYKEGANG